MSVSQKMFACSSFALIAVLMFTQANPVPVPEEVHPAEYGQFVSARVVQSGGEPAVFEQEAVELGPAAVRPVRSASPFFGILGGYEKPYKTQHHHHHHEVYEPEHHRPQYHHEEYEPEHHRPQYHHQPQHHNGGGGAGSYASAGNFAGGHGGGHSQSAANSQSASFGFGPFQASYSASSAHSGSHSNRGSSDYFD